MGQLLVCGKQTLEQVFGEVAFLTCKDASDGIFISNLLLVHGLIFTLGGCL